MATQKQIRLNAALKRQAALDASLKGKTWAQVAQIAGYASAGAACAAVDELLKSVSVKSADRYRTESLRRLDLLDEVAWDVLGANHIHVSASGKVVKDIDPETGQEFIVTDHAPVLRALAEIRKNDESRRKLMGVDAPTRTKIELEQHDALDAEIESMMRELSEQAGEQVGPG